MRKISFSSWGYWNIDATARKKIYEEKRMRSTQTIEIRRMRLYWKDNISKANWKDSETDAWGILMTSSIYTSSE